MASLSRTAVNAVLSAAILSIVALFVSSCASSASTPYMPLVIGNTWEYRFTTLPDKSENTFTMQITERDKRGFRMPEPSGGPSWWRIENGFLVLERTGEVLRFFEIPIRTGVSWWIRGADGGRYCVRVMAFEYVGVPAGDFLKALRVEMENEDRSKQAVFHFARDVGLVKRVSFEHSRLLSLELLRFTPGGSGSP